MRALVTGVAGQDGFFLSAALLSRGWNVTGSRLRNEILSSQHPLDSKHTVVLDVTDASSVEKVVGELKPDVIYHLAGITSVGLSFKDPEFTKFVNVGGTRNILESAIKCGLNNTLVVHAASTEIFSDKCGIISETTIMDPRSPYGESKAEAYALCLEYRKHGVKVTNAILANHESFLRSNDFVTGKIANSAARISMGLQTELRLGNMDVTKNWSAAADVVEGMVRIAENEFVGDVIFASGASTHLHEIIKCAFAYVGIANWQDYVKSDLGLVRAGESNSIEIDPSKAFDLLGWQAVTPLDKWIGEMVQYHLDTLVKDGVAN
jgi:GDPmannose 4,6-dehydratase